MESLRSMLTGGDRRSLGRADDVVDLLQRKLGRLPELIECLWDDDAVVRMRASDVLEKLSPYFPDLIGRFKAELFGLAEETPQAELKWHLVMVISRLRLSDSEVERAVAIIRRYLEDRSAIVKTCALQAMSNLAFRHLHLVPDAIDMLDRAAVKGTAAMKARARRLLRVWNATCGSMGEGPNKSDYNKR